MLMLILTWTGAVLGLSLLLIMALGPVIVELDSRWYERKHKKRRAQRRINAAADNAVAPAPGARPANGPRIAVRTQPTSN